MDAIIIMINNLLDSPVRSGLSVKMSQRVQALQLDNVSPRPHQLGSILTLFSIIVGTSLSIVFIIVWINSVMTGAV